MNKPTITGPSNTGVDPVFTLGTVSSPVVRTGIQGTLTAGIIRLVEVVPSPDLVISSGDRDILFVVLLGVVSFVQNFTEKYKGRRLIGTSR
jgi:hypothetical protein